MAFVFFFVKFRVSSWIKNFLPFTPNSHFFQRSYSAGLVQPGRVALCGSILRSASKAMPDR